jgi:hypothetical protein
MYDLAGEHELDLEALRVRLRGMIDRELLRFGKSARYMCSPEANLGKASRQVFVLQLKEAVKEWRLRQQAGKLPVSHFSQLCRSRICVLFSRKKGGRHPNTPLRRPSASKDTGIWRC